ncbi:MAG: choloylglycine hydrolase [Syntrophus sp. (in: bacteria)]|nr:choloylglycine hydrolase [Syntrophus sp. (in: bacteria)]
MNTKKLLMVAIATMLLLQGVVISSEACTGTKLKADDGSIVTGRTMEFGLKAPSAVTIVPRGTETTASGPSGKAGLKWKSSYATVGVSGWGQPKWYVEGLNEKGLAAGVFYMPGFGQYQTAKPGEEGRSISQNDFIYYVLSTSATVGEALKAIGKVVVVAADADPAIVTDPAMRGAMPFHMRITDAVGRSVVIEYTAKGVQIYENPLGVITNAPTFDWHLLNMRNYVNLKVADAPPMEFNGQTISQLGMGSGLHGLPGDFTPPSRFIRAAIFTMNLVPGKTATEAVGQAWHLLHLFDIPSGVSGSKVNGAMVYDTAQWTSVTDHKNLRFYFNTYDDYRVRMIDMNRVNLNAEKPITIPFGDTLGFIDVTPSTK